jgi:hypothetical protein
MGRKSSAKLNRPPGSGATPPAPPGSSGAPSRLIIGAVILLVAVVGLLAFARSSGSGSSGAATPSTGASQATGTAGTPAPQASGETPAAAKLGPHFQANLPPLPFIPTPPARPTDVVRAAYQFAAEHPEVLSYVPCYCGCERSGHRGNEDCFVTNRDANGDVTEWEPHGMT